MSGFEQAGVEIIPFEPDQRSDLRRESPQCRTYLTPLSLSGLGQFQELLTSSFSFFHQQQLGYKQVRRCFLGPELCNFELSCRSLCIAAGICWRTSPRASAQ